MARAPAQTPLSERELEALGLVADGLSNDQIADAAYVSVHAVKSRLKSASRKLGLHGRVALANWFRDHHQPQKTTRMGS